MVNRLHLYSASPQPLRYPQEFTKVSHSPRQKPHNQLRILFFVGIFVEFTHCLGSIKWHLKVSLCKCRFFTLKYPHTLQALLVWVRAIPNVIHPSLEKVRDGLAAWRTRPRGLKFVHNEILIWPKEKNQQQRTNCWTYMIFPVKTMGLNILMHCRSVFVWNLHMPAGVMQRSEG